MNANDDAGGANNGDDVDRVEEPREPFIADGDIQGDGPDDVFHAGNPRGICPVCLFRRRTVGERCYNGCIRTLLETGVCPNYPTCAEGRFIVRYHHCHECWAPSVNFSENVVMSSEIPILPQFLVQRMRENMDPVMFTSMVSDERETIANQAREEEE